MKLSRAIIISCTLMISGIMGFGLSLYRHKLAGKKEVLVIQTFHYPALFVSQLKNDPDAGRKIFKEFCTVCHAKEPQIDIKAPRIGDKAVWKALQKLGKNKLLKMTLEGVGAMPARGGCFECSDEQLAETIQYILNQSQ
jgi:cytochrome c5